jgi:hypothetical protein
MAWQSETGSGIGKNRPKQFLVVDANFLNNKAYAPLSMAG